MQLLGGTDRAVLEVCAGALPDRGFGVQGLGNSRAAGSCRRGGGP